MGVDIVTSLDDRRVANYKLIGDHRALVERGVFVAEGRLVVKRLLTSQRFAIQSILLTDAAVEGMRDALAAHPPAAPVYVIDQDAMNQLVGFNIHRGCLAMASRPAAVELTVALVRSARRIVVLERVSNPDNVGGIFRSAAAFAADLVVLGPDCGDPLYRKAVRTSMGAVLSVPFVSAGAWPDAIGLIREAGVTVAALTPRADATALREFTRSFDAVALLIGHEGEGLTETALAEAAVRLRIPMTGSVDSLNAASAASIAMYQVWSG